jgi:hypothetical protein
MNRKIVAGAFRAAKGVVVGRGVVYTLWGSSLLRLLARGSHEHPRKIDPYMYRCESGRRGQLSYAVVGHVQVA